MRNQQGLPGQGRDLYPALDSLCGDSAARSTCQDRKGKICPERGRRCPSLSPPSSHCPSPASRRCPGSGSSSPFCHIHWWDSENCCSREKSVIAQPIFIFEKKDRSCKRHAEDLVYKAEHDCSVCPVKRARSTSLTHSPSYSQISTDARDSEKRARSSSFTFIPTFPPSQTVEKNNFFRPATFHFTKSDGTGAGAAGTGNAPQWTLIRPAVLQPPHVQLCAEEIKKTKENVPMCPKKDSLRLKSFTENICPVEHSTSKADKVAMSYNCTLVSNKSPPRSQPEEDMGMPESNNSEFVFGENMIDRVLCPQKSTGGQIESAQYKRESTSRMSDAAQKTSDSPHATLVESAAACSSKSSQNYKMEKMDVVTGEEAERNVLQINCKLFVLNTITQSWTEKGRGSLRLNDMSRNGCGTLQSRLVMRNHGSLRLIFNTKLWAQMKIERANRKSLRIIGTDLEDDAVRVFLIQASAKDAGRLYAAIHHRLVALRISAEQETNVDQTEAEPETGISLLNVNSDDDEDEDSNEATHCGRNRKDHARWIRREPVMYL